MIKDKVIYQNKLEVLHEQITQLISPANLYEVRYVDFELSIFTSSFFIRKLYDDHKISNEMMLIKIPIKKYNLKKCFNNHLIDINYDMKKPIITSIPLKHMLNQIMHSLVFEMTIDQLSAPGADNINDELLLDEEATDYIVDGFFFTSDHHKSELCFMDITNFLILLENIYSDDIDSKSYERIRNDANSIIKTAVSSSRRPECLIRPFIPLD